MKRKTISLETVFSKEISDRIMSSKTWQIIKVQNKEQVSWLSSEKKSSYIIVRTGFWISATRCQMGNRSKCLLPQGWGGERQKDVCDGWVPPYQTKWEWILGSWEIRSHGKTMSMGRKHQGPLLAPTYTDPYMLTHISNFPRPSKM